MYSEKKLTKHPHTYAEGERERESYVNIKICLKQIKVARIKFFLIFYKIYDE